MREGYVAHHVFGRLRLRVPAAKNDLGFLDALAGEIEQVEGIEWVRLSPITGSVILEYDTEEVDPARMLEAVRRAAHRQRLALPELTLSVPTSQSAFGEDQVSPREPSLAAQKLLRALTELNRELKRETGNAVDLQFLLPLASVFAGVVTARRPQSSPMWLTLVTFAFNAFIALHSPPRLASRGGNSFELARTDE